MNKMEKVYLANLIGLRLWFEYYLNIVNYKQQLPQNATEMLLY